MKQFTLATGAVALAAALALTACIKDAPTPREPTVTP